MLIKDDPRKHTQSVERSHCSIKMRLRIGRGLYRHNLQAVMDFEDFVHNRTDGKPATIFKRLGDAAIQYVTTVDFETARYWNIPIMLNADDIDIIEGINTSDFRKICSSSVFRRSKRYQVKKSTIISTQACANRNCIEGKFRAVRILEQCIWWRGQPSVSTFPVPFNIQIYKCFVPVSIISKKTEFWVNTVYIS